MATGEAVVGEQTVMPDRVNGESVPAAVPRRWSLSNSGRGWRWWASALVLTISAVVLAIALGGHRRHDPTIDVFDEGAHYEYVLALRSGHIPAWGDQMTLQERRFVDCLYSVSTPPAPCGAKPLPSSDYPANGYDYEAQQPPLGYLPYVATAQPGASPKQAMAAARHGGIIWLAVSAVGLLLFAALEDLSPFALAGLLGICMLNPSFTWAAATINNDASGVAAGTVGLIAWSLSRRWRGAALWLGIAAGLLIGLTKGLYVVIPLALVVADLLTGDKPTRSTVGAWVRHRATALAMFGASVTAFVGWTVLQTARQVVPSSVVLRSLLGGSKVSTFRPGMIGQGVVAGLSVFQPYYPGTWINAVWGVAVFGVLFGLMFLPHAGAISEHARGLAVGTLLGILVLAAGWTALTFIQGHFNQSIVQRYAIPFLPLIAYSIVLACRRWAIAVLCIGTPLIAASLQLWSGKY